MRNNYLEKPFQKFLELSYTQDYFIKDVIHLSEKNAKTLLNNLKEHCYLISYNQTKFFDIEETFYDAEDLRYERLKRLKRKKTIQVKTQKIHLNNEIQENNLLINYQSFHKNRQLSIKLKKEVEDWEINAILQTKSLSFPLLKHTHSISFTRVYLYQPHTKTKIYIDLDFYSENKQLPEAKVTVISKMRNNPITKKIKQ